MATAAAELVKFGVVDTRPAECPTHGPFTEQLVRFAGKERWGGCSKCVADKQDREREEHHAKLARDHHEAMMRSMMNQAAIPVRFQSRTLDTYSAELPEQQRALAVAVEYADQFDQALANGRSLVFCGLPGTGKT